jgi:hypothetical protein
VRRRFSGKEVGEVCRLYREGLTLQRIADRYRCNQSTVWRLLKRAGVRLRKRGDPHAPRPATPPPAWLDRAIAVYTAGGTLHDAAAAVGVPYLKVYYQFKKAGVPRRRVGRPRKAVLEGLRALWQQATGQERETFLAEVGRKGR